MITTGGCRRECRVGFDTNHRTIFNITELVGAHPLGLTEDRTTSNGYWGVWMIVNGGTEGTGPGPDRQAPR